MSALPLPSETAPFLPAPAASASRIPHPASRRLLPLLETAAALLLLLASLALHWQQNGAAGGLWRDEATSIQVANMPDLATVWRYLEFDSYPILYHLLLRGWSGLFTADDASLRVLGLLIGLGVLGACWLAVRALGVRVPLFCLALLGLNPLFIRYGDSTRAYGLGSALAVLAAAAVWRAAAADRVRWSRLLLAMLAGVVSVQCLYHNAALLLASCLGGAAAALGTRRWRVAVAVLASGIPAAVSLLPYLPTIHRTGQWSVLFKYPVTLAWLWRRVSEVTGSPDPLGVWLWTALCLAALAFTAWQLLRSRLPHPASRIPLAFRPHPPSLIPAASLLSAAAIYAAFLLVVGYVTQPWYYLAFLAFAAVCLDGIFGQSAALAAPAARWTRLLLAAGFALLVFPQARQALTLRHTNIDLVAARLRAGVRPGDLVVVNRWECAISLQRYPLGPAPLLTVPPIPDHAVHRYDLIMDCMKSPDPLRPLFEAMETTLRAGGRVWLVGPPLRTPDGQPAPVLPPARPDGKGRWRAGMYYSGWSLQVGDFLAAHCTDGEAPGVSPRQPVSEYENVPLTRFGGWR